jgi:hypothetical protein
MRPTARRTPALLLASAATLVPIACSPRGDAGDRPAAPVAQCDLNSSATPTAVKSATAGAAVPIAGTAHVHNLFRLSPSILSGSAPEGDGGFEELRALGVRTVVSVDGATPDVARAEAHGLRYVHVPTTYATVTPAQRLEIARAVRDLPGPVFIHCHHGKHRGPAAAASAAVALGLITPEQGLAFMHQAGTAASYPGLFACVRGAAPAAPAEIDSAPAEFPSVRRPAGLVACMVEIDDAYDHLGRIRAAGWAVPADHPDLVPASEAARVVEGLRLAREDARARASEDLSRRLAEAIERASAVEEGLAAVRRPGVAELEARWSALGTSCAGCHAAHRDPAP